MSLDYTLKEASHIHISVVELLEELHTTLEGAYRIWYSSWIWLAIIGMSYSVLLDT